MLEKLDVLHYETLALNFFCMGRMDCWSGQFTIFRAFFGMRFFSRCFAIFVNIEREKVRARLLGT